MRRWILCALVLSACGGGEESSSWARVDVPGSGAQGETYSIWAFAEDDVWLGGSSVWNWDGGEWTEVALPAVGTFVGAFWGFAPDDLWAMGSNHVFRWDGAQWTESPAAEGLPFEALAVIWGSSSSDLWIANADNSKVYHYDGTAWTRETLQFTQAYALWGSGPSDVWLTGPFDAYHYDGASWSVYEPEGFEYGPRGAFAMWGASAGDVWASTGPGFVHWDGSTWNEIEADDEYNSMWGFGADEIYAVGNRGSMARFDGTRWSESGGHLKPQQNFTHVHGSSPDNVWATAVDFDTFGGFVLRLQ